MVCLVCDLAPTTISSTMEAGYPLETFKADTLRSMCRDLGYKNLVRRDTMIEFLTSVQDEGVDKALEKYISLSVPRSPRKSLSAPPLSSTSSSRKRPSIISDYDTRYKNKRIKTVDDSPRKRGRPRKNPPTPNPESSKRGRGRPRKHPVTPTQQQSAPVVKRGPGRPRKRPLAPQLNGRSPLPQKKVEVMPRDRQIFDGVVLPERRFKLLPAKKKALSPEIPPLTHDEDANGEDDDEILPLVENDMEESSLGGSNKENDMSIDGPENHENADNHTVTSRVLERHVPMQIVRDGVEEGGEVDADGEADAEGEIEPGHEAEAGNGPPAIKIREETETITTTPRLRNELPTPTTTTIPGQES